MAATATAAVDTACRGCHIRVRLPADEVARLLDQYLREHPGPVVGDELYGDRLATCRACEALEYGSTCRHCGCLVQVRAKLAGGRCPHPGGSRWAAEEL